MVLRRITLLTRRKFIKKMYITHTQKVHGFDITLLARRKFIDMEEIVY